MDESIEEDHLLFYPKGKYAVAEIYELHSSIDSVTKNLQWESRRRTIRKIVRSRLYWTLFPLSDRLVNNNRQEPRAKSQELCICICIFRIGLGERGGTYVYILFVRTKTSFEKGLASSDAMISSVCSILAHPPRGLLGYCELYIFLRVTIKLKISGLRGPWPATSRI